MPVAIDPPAGLQKHRIWMLSGSADSVGRLTTQSVVESIFVVIVADAAFSIIFSILKI